MASTIEYPPSYEEFKNEKIKQILDSKVNPIQEGLKELPKSSDKPSKPKNEGVL
jgi:hypothetical protein